MTLNYQFKNTRKGSADGIITLIGTEKLSQSAEITLWWGISQNGEAVRLPE
jgi:hypothetical protein